VVECGWDGEGKSCDMEGEVGGMEGSGRECRDQAMGGRGIIGLRMYLGREARTGWC
jgi:hypothetical protein